MERRNRRGEPDTGLQHLLASTSRLARHLLDLAANTQRGEDLLVRASHHELADHIGTVREVVARTLATLRADGYLVTEGNLIRLVDPHALATLP